MKQSKRSTFKLLFYLKKNEPKKDGTIPIMGRITIDGKIAQFSTRLSVDLKKWDLKFSRVSGRDNQAKSLNQKLDTIRVRINQSYNDSMLRYGFASAQRVKNSFLGIGIEHEAILPFFKEHNEQIDVVAATYDITYKYLEKFLIHKYNNRDFRFKELNDNFINDFERFLKTNIGLAHNTTIKEELQRFNAVIPENKNEELVQDLFVFSCFTSLAYTDAIHLRKDELQYFLDGSLWIIKRRQKTTTASNLRLLDIPMKIVQKYQDFSDEFVFPYLSNVTVNKYLKSLQQKAKINKHITFHVARHTFAFTQKLQTRKSAKI